MVLFSSISRLLFSFSAFYLVSTDAAASLRVNKSCFAVNENIAISFQNDSPRSDDWVGFYGTSTSLSSVPSPSGDRWLWTCGSTSCTSSQGISRSTITFTSFLPVGTWKVILTRDDDGGSPYVGVAQSTSFVVSNSCSPASPSARVPTRRPTVAPARTANTAAAFTAARSEIESLIIGSRGNQRLAAMFLRLGFHDCVGGCDGCVDLTNPDNNGLLVPVQALRNVVSRHANSVTKITRADIWALATAVGADVLQTRVRVDFDLLTVGRINCENANTVCRNENGAQQPCSDVRGPHRALPGMNTNSRELFTFFADEFNFSVKDTVAIMGAHTIGVLRKSEVGVDGPNGWLPDNNVFDNGYYHELIGGTSASNSLDVHINQAPNWQKSAERNNPNGIPDQFIWTGFPNGEKIVMLNVDICIVRELDSSNMDKDGRVNCNFRQEGACPHNQRSIQFAIDYAFDNRLWLNDFRSALLRMLNNGYTRTSTCDGKVCFLRAN